MMKRILSLLLSLGTLFLLTSCAGTPAASDDGSSQTNSDGEPDPNKPTEGVTYSSIDYPAETLTFEDAPAYAAQVKQADGNWYNGPTDRGLVTSPYFTVTVNGENYPVYATRATTSIHSFVYIEVSNPQDEKLSMDLEISLGQLSPASCTVLPESSAITANLTGGKVTAHLTELGYYTMIFDDSHTYPLTFIVREEEPFVCPEGYRVLKMSPGRYDKLTTSPNTVLYFTKGSYELYDITLLRDSMVYFETGTYVKALNLNNGGGFLHGWGTPNVKIQGHALVDFSGQAWHTYCPIAFTRADNMELSGLTLLNSSHWTIPTAQTKNVRVYDMVLIGYRENSDGITMIDCEDATVENCFVRTGDDVFLVKSTLSREDSYPIVNNNIRFKNCQAWADKTRAIGVIAETVRDTHNVWFEDCAVLFNQASWSENLGALVVTSWDATKVYDIHFNNIEIYRTDFWPISIYGENDGTNIYDIYFENIRFNTDYRIQISNAKGGTIGNIYLDDIYNAGVRIEKLEDLAFRYGGSCSLSNIQLNTQN